MKSVNKIVVTYHNTNVGSLSMTPDNRLCAFQYDKDWLAHGFSISPLDLPLKSDLFIAKPGPFWGNFGIFEDSLPDGYGRYLLPKLEYKTLLHLTGYLTQDPKQVDEMFQRMVFNVLTENKDDHAKNFSFIYKEGIWKLAPAYDLTRCSNGYNGEHATSVNNHANPTIEDMLIVGESIRIPRKKGREIIFNIADGCSEILSKDYILS